MKSSSSSSSEVNWSEVTDYNHTHSQYLYNDAQHQNHLEKSKLSNARTLILTDRSHEYEPEETYENHTGGSVSMFISKKKNDYHHFWQAFGSQSIFYAEVCAIAVIKQLMNELNLFIKDGIEIFCDYQSVFESIYKQSNDELHPFSFKKCRELVNDYSIIIHKVKSHVSSSHMIGNDIADHHAGLAINIPFNHEIPLIWFN